MLFTHNYCHVHPLDFWHRAGHLKVAVYAEVRSGRGGQQAGMQTQLSPRLAHLDQVAKLTWPQFPLL